MGASGWVRHEDCNGVGCEFCLHTGRMLKMPRINTLEQPDQAQAVGYFERDVQQLKLGVANVRSDLNDTWAQLLPDVRTCGNCKSGADDCHYCHGYGALFKDGSTLDYATAALWLRLERVRLQAEHQRLAGMRYILRDLMPAKLPDVHPDNNRGLGGAKYVGD